MNEATDELAQVPNASATRTGGRAKSSPSSRARKIATRLPRRGRHGVDGGIEAFNEVDVAGARDITELVQAPRVSATCTGGRAKSSPSSRVRKFAPRLPLRGRHGSGADAPGFAWFEYDEAGNMVEAQVLRPLGGGVTELRLTWDALGRLTAAERLENGNATKLTFAYDYAGQRVSKQLLRANGTLAPPECGRAGSGIPALYDEDQVLYPDAATEVRSCRLTKYVYAGGARVAQMVTEVPEQRLYRDDDIAPYLFFSHREVRNLRLARACAPCPLPLAMHGTTAGGGSVTPPLLAANAAPRDGPALLLAVALATVAAFANEEPTAALAA